MFATLWTPLGESNLLKWIDVPPNPDYGEQHNGQMIGQNHPTVHEQEALNITLGALRLP